VQPSHEEAVAESQRLLHALEAAEWTSLETALSPTDWRSADSAQIALVKRGDRRAIYRVDLPHESLYVKHRWSTGGLGRLVDRLRGSASRREFHHAREAAKRGVPTTDCVALGETSKGKDAADFLVTRAVQDAAPLDQFLTGHLATLSPRARCLLVQSLAALCALVHDAGLEHDDLHAGNILIVWSDLSQQPDLRLIDLDRARIGKPLGWRAVRRNLAMLYCGLHHVATERDCWRFWRTYRKRRAALAVDVRRGAHEVWRRGMDRVWRVLRDRDRRALRSNREFHVLRSAHGVALAVCEISQAMLCALLESPDALLCGPGTEALKLSFGSVVVKTSFAEPTRDVVFKRIRAKSLFKQLLAPFRASRARVGWYRGHALLARGIATARPLFALEPRAAWWRGESYLATEWIPGAENLHLWLWRVAALPERQRRSLIRQSATALGALLGKMHRYGVAHRDLKGCNLAAAEFNGAWRWYVLDLEGVRLRRRVTFAERASDLTRLAVSAGIHPCLSRADRLRFLRAYAQVAGERDDIKQLWRAIAAKSRRELERFARRGKGVA